MTKSGAAFGPPFSFGARSRLERVERPAGQFELFPLAAEGREHGIVERDDMLVAGATRLARANALNEIPPQALQSLNEAGHTVKLNYFLREVLTRNPELPLWSTYISVAARAGQTNEMLALVRKRAAAKSLSPARSTQRKIRSWSWLPSKPLRKPPASRASAVS